MILFFCKLQEETKAERLRNLPMVTQPVRLPLTLIH